MLNENVQLLAAKYYVLLKVRSENWPKFKPIECGGFLYLTYLKSLYARSQYNEPYFTGDPES